MGSFDNLWLKQCILEYLG